MRSETAYALIDGNNFYVSCERVFNPRLHDRPVVVLSNNDGCIIARSNEAKALGIRMGQPWFEVRPTAARLGLVALSSNYALYADMSARLMRVLAAFAPRQEIYSIDECFLDMSGIPAPERLRLAQELRARAARWLGLPVGVGLGPSKTLAKLANHRAKRLPELDGVCDLSGPAPAMLDAHLASVAIGDVWGVGRRLAPRLEALGIHSALDLRQTNPARLRERFSVTLARTVNELRGQSCLAIEDVPALQQQIVNSRSFGQPVNDPTALREALTQFTSRAAEKLRRQRACAGLVGVHLRLRTGPGREGLRDLQAALPLPRPSSDTRVLLRAALALLTRLYPSGASCVKAGILLGELSAPSAMTADLFTDRPQTERDARLMQTLDAINTRLGRDSLRLASEGPSGPRPWHGQQTRRSPRYTTHPDELPRAQANASAFSTIQAAPWQQLYLQNEGFPDN